WRAPRCGDPCSCTGLRTWAANAQPVAVGVAQLDLAPPGLLVRVGAELGRDGVDLGDAHVDERVRARVAAVLREEDLHAPARDLDEGRHVRLEAVLPPLDEAEPRVPRDRDGG